MNLGKEDGWMDGWMDGWKADLTGPEPCPMTGFDSSDADSMGSATRELSVNR
jgi:hypothetical protein